MKVGDLVLFADRRDGQVIALVLQKEHGWVECLLNGKTAWIRTRTCEVISESR